MAIVLMITLAGTALAAPVSREATSITGAVRSIALETDAATGEATVVVYDTFMEYHWDGMDFGVVAQALWMNNKVEGDTVVFAALPDAKQSGDYSGVTLPVGSSLKI
jgi:hypothetical protein